MSGVLARSSVDEVLDEFFADRIVRAGALGTAYAELWRRAAAAARGGKRIRPRLLLAAHDELGGRDERTATEAAAAFELLHTALLIHDDILDGDLSRRGEPNLAGRFTASALDGGLAPVAATAWGQASGLLAGDLLISGAHSLIARGAPATRSAVHEIVDECLFRAAAGEQADVGFGLGAMAAGHAAIVRMMRDKTAAYSFAAPLRAGATLARASEAVREELGRIGMRLGVLYQLRDDVLGVFGERDLTGKSVTGDLREGKRTLLVALAEPHPAWQEVRHLFGRRSLDPSDAERLRGALVDSGALRWIEGIILGLRERVDRRIARSSLPSGLRRELSALASSCAERDA